MQVIFYILLDTTLVGTVTSTSSATDEKRAVTEGENSTNVSGWSLRQSKRPSASDDTTSKLPSQPIQIQEIREIINDVVRTGDLKFLTGGIAIGDTASPGAGPTAHQDVERHVTDNKGS